MSGRVEPRVPKKDTLMSWENENLDVGGILFGDFTKQVAIANIL